MTKQSLSQSIRSCSCALGCVGVILIGLALAAMLLLAV